MGKSTFNGTPDRIARTAGLLYTLMIPLGIFGIMYVPATLVVAGDAAATAVNIVLNTGLFRLSIVAALLVQISHIFIVLLLYKLLISVNRNHAVLMVIFLLISVPLTMINELNNFAVLLLAGGADSLNAFTSGQVQALTSILLDLHEFGILIAGIFWGLWLLPMGYLVYKSDFLPKFLGVLLIIACSGYVIDSFSRMIFPGYGTTIMANIIVFTMFGEIVFPLWLLIKGVKVEEGQN
ncbi:MAG: DUF4386 domain-containing protein [Spirochaetaceae bacterium]|nr:DUF4386 domain-containing protein [Spirochaetaceae bacterium]